MGDVIDFRPKEKRVEVTLDPQAKIEKCIVSYWKSLGGFDIELDEFDYLLIFMAFSDTCFTELELGNMVVHEDDMMTVKPDLHKKLKGTIDGITKTPPANDE